MTTHILVIDDERAIRRFLYTSLTAHGYVVLEAATGQEGVSGAREHHPDLIILDMGLPDMNGLDVTRRLRESAQVPVIILSVNGQEALKVAALDAGADDYLTKPFGVSELLARIRVALRHAAPAQQLTSFASGDLNVDLERRLVTLAGEEVHLTPIEYNLLRVMVLNAGKVVTHRQLLRQVWGAAYEQESHLLRVNVSNLRNKIEPEPARPRYVLTEPGVGYRLKVD